MDEETNASRFLAAHVIADAIRGAALIFSITTLIITVLWLRTWSHQASENRKEHRIESCMTAPDLPTPEPGCNVSMKGKYR